MKETNPEDVNTQKHNVLILQEHYRHYPLARVNRYLLYWVAILMCLVVLLGFLAWPQKNTLEDLKAHVAPATPANQALSAEINLLKGQVAGLVSGSIESKLRMLEDNIRAGSLNNALGALQDLRREVKILETYSEAKIAVAAPKATTDAILLAEVSHLKNLIYLTLASVSLIFAAVAGVWAGKRYRLNHQKSAYLSQHNHH